jgi:hypothetical protein
VLLVCLLVLRGGPSESTETLSWVLAFAVALPGGLALASWQEVRLASAAPAAAVRGLAAGLALLAYGLFLRHSGSGDGLHHGLLAITAAAALVAPLLAAREWRDPADDRRGGAWALAAASLVALTLLFVPSAALEPSALFPALALAALALVLLRLRWTPPADVRFMLEVVICVGIALAVVQTPDLRLYAADLIHHQGYFLGPANDVAHGRAMLADVWSQYGVASIDSLGLFFSIVPIGYGTLALLLIALATAQYLCTYAILRLAGVGQLLAALAMAVAVMGNLFWPIAIYVAFPSDTALRFGLPYLIVLAAVLGARFPARRDLADRVVLGLLAFAAIWSFETFVYCGATYGALVLVEALRSDNGVMQRVLRGALVGLGVSAVSVLTYSVLALLFNGEVSWGPYVEYLRLYTADEFGQLPVELFSAGPMMGAAVFLGAATLAWLARCRREAIEPPMWTALAGLTGFAVAIFTYYLGRSHPNNLLILLPPIVALGGLWTHLLLSRPAPWRTAGVATLLTAGAMIVVASWPSFEEAWKETALGAFIQGASLTDRLERLADNPALDPRAPAVAAMLAEHLPPEEPVAVLTERELTTEILMHAGRHNLLPISNPSEDALIASSAGRVRAGAEDLSPGTLLLISPAEFNGLQLTALEVLERRFDFEPVASAEGLELVRLVPKGERLSF